MKDRRRPSVLKVETRGVAKDGKGKDTFDVSVIVDGVRVVKVGDGGNTKRVCEGVETIETGLGLDTLCAFRGV